jgi:hypothetical protein
MEDDMNEVFEQKLRELIDEAERQGVPAAYVVLNLLYGNYRNGTHHQFAQHCCRFSPLDGLKVTVDTTGRMDKQEDIWEGLDSVKYHN